jgi:hypothetical protein
MDDELWLTWARSNENVKIVTTPIPYGILPLNVVGKIHDVKVFHKKQKRGDDYLYNNHPELRKQVARGHCLIELEYDDGRKSVKCVIRALNKFTSNDERDVCWKEYFTKPIDQAVEIVCTSKTNGEAAHLAPFLIDDQIYLCAGSKNVHVVFKNKKHLAMYDDEPRYRIAMEICQWIVVGFDIGSKHNMYCYMLENQLTAVMELLSVDHQHIVDVEKSTLKFIAWTSTVDRTSLLPIRPDHGLEVAKEYGFDTIEYRVIGYSEFESHVKEIERSTDMEGEVMYFVDDENHTIGLLKKKSIWYVIIRAIREKLRQSIKKELDVEKLSKKFHEKLVDTQKWLKFDNFDEWYDIGHEFFKWIKRQQTEKTVGRVQHTFESYFPSMINEFKETLQDKYVCL